MTPTPHKKNGDRLESLIRGIKDVLEILKKQVDWIEHRQRSMTDNIQHIREQQSIMNEKLDEHTETLQMHTEKLDALLVDVHELKDDAKANWDKITIVDEKHTKAIKEIGEHVGLAS